MSRNKLGTECIPVLSYIFVRWKWMLTTAVVLFLTFGELSYKHGEKNQKQDNSILNNKEMSTRIEDNLIRIEYKIDTLIYMKRKGKK